MRKSIVQYRIIYFANDVQTEQGKRSTFVIAQIYSNSTVAFGGVFLKKGVDFLIQRQWIYCIFDQLKLAV